ncbi:hypothetical protein J3R74_003937 [Puniceicoccus vermicola]
MLIVFKMLVFGAFGEFVDLLRDKSILLFEVTHDNR